MLLACNAWDIKRERMLYGIHLRDDYRNIIESNDYEILPHTQYFSIDGDDIFLGDIVDFHGLLCKVEQCLGAFILRRVDGNDFDLDWLNQYTTSEEWSGFITETCVTMLSVAINSETGESSVYLDVDKVGNIYEDPLIMDGERRNSEWQGF